MSVAQSRSAKTENNTGLLLWRVSAGWQRQQREALKPLGLTHTQFVVLAAVGALGREQETVAQSDIAAHAKIDASTTGQVVATLEEKGWVRRSVNPQDERAFAIAITKSGQAVLSKATPSVERVDERFFAALGRREEAFHAALTVLATGSEQHDNA